MDNKEGYALKARANRAGAAELRRRNRLHHGEDLRKLALMRLKPWGILFSLVGRCKIAKLR